MVADKGRVRIPTMNNRIVLLRLDSERQTVADADVILGLDVAEHYKVSKYEPPMRCSDGDAARRRQ